MRKTIYNQSYKSTIEHTIDTINDFYWKSVVKNSKIKLLYSIEDGQNVDAKVFYLMIFS